MRKALQLAAAVTLLSAAAAPARAQIIDPGKLVAPPPKNPALHDNKPLSAADNLQWLWQFTKPQPGGNGPALRFDERFGALVENEFKQPQAMWGQNVPLSDVILRFVSQYPTVTAENNRYISFDGCVPSFCAAHGMLWADLGQPHPLLVFAAVHWTEQAHTTDETKADYNLWLFPNRQLSPDALPFALTQSIAHWDVRLATAHRLVPHIAHAVLVEPDGTPLALDPSLAGANTLPPQPDTITPKPPDTD